MRHLVEIQVFVPPYVDTWLTDLAQNECASKSALVRRYVLDVYRAANPAAVPPDAFNEVRDASTRTLPLPFSTKGAHAKRRALDAKHRTKVRKAKKTAQSTKRTTKKGRAS